MRIERFEIKEEHLKLLNNTCVKWNDNHFGAPTIDPKRPYGNSNVEGDITKILGWKYVKEDEDDEMREYQFTNAIHKETQIALQICLKLLKFEVGIYENIGYGREWKKIS